MIYVSVSSDAKRVAARMHGLADGLNSKATVRALNRANDSAYTEADKRIRDIYNIKKKDLAPAFKKEPARGSQASLSAELVVKGVRIGLIAFDAKMAARGRKGVKAGDVTVQVLRSKGRTVVRGKGAGRPFIQTLKGNPGVLQRVGKARYPIKYLRSLSVPRAFLNKVVLAAVRKTSTAVFVKNYQQQVTFLLQDGR